ncbi:hypothetical protein RINTHM_1020 [Richelia intracellularis HM01]|nr:hypothetical protein [Richelia intracellularis]CCH64585.1 hypothetical protein RINTHM_1020 [Richelia intracellularis HM01]
MKDSDIRVSEFLEIVSTYYLESESIPFVTKQQKLSLLEMIEQA